MEQAQEWKGRCAHLPLRCRTTVGISNLYMKAGEIVRLCIVLATLRPTRDDDDGLMHRRERVDGLHAHGRRKRGLSVLQFS